MRYFILLPLLLTVGCGNPHNARTVSEWKDAHPYAKHTATFGQSDGTRQLLYEDAFPRISASGSCSTEVRTYLVYADSADKVLDVKWGAQ